MVTVTMASCRRSKEKSSCRSKPGETVGTQQSELNSVHFGLTASWKCKEDFLWTAYHLGRKRTAGSVLPSGQLDESVQTNVWTSIIVTEIHAIRRGLVLMQDRAHLATISRALMIKLKDGPNGQTCAEDDCVGSPCGQGGRCTDLWSFGGPEGSYKCECSEGYE